MLQILAGDKKGRKFLLYVIGIALFIVLLPLIATLALFGWMSGGGVTDMIDYDMVYNELPTEQQEQMEQYDDRLDLIAVTFEENGLSRTEISQAKTIYISCLVGKESEEGFYQTYAECFLNRTEENDLLDNISSAFGVIFSEREREQFENLYS